MAIFNRIEYSIELLFLSEEKSMKYLKHEYTNDAYKMWTKNPVVWGKNLEKFHRTKIVSFLLVVWKNPDGFVW